jgi:hypothetical protein
MVVINGVEYEVKEVGCKRCDCRSFCENTIYWDCQTPNKDAAKGFDCMALLASLGYTVDSKHDYGFKKVGKNQ